jgi:threonine aldolase
MTTDSRAAVDLRSDTVTRPTAAMKRAMVEAALGDDVLGDDPTVLALERRVATLAGKDAAVFVPSGTMGNQLALMVHAGPGDEVLVEGESHVFVYEQGGLSANAGALAHPLASARGALDPAAIVHALREEDEHVARVRVVCMENTHNRHGGAVVPLERMQAVAAAARGVGMRVHLDGARLWNAAVATGVPIAAWAATADTVMMCFSKGLGAPVGSILVGDADTIRIARRHRKRLGGAMRQVGMLAGACLHALDHHIERMTDDHRRARVLAAGFAAVPGVRVIPPDTNIVVVDLEHPALDRDTLVRELDARGTRILDFGARRVRAITHLDVDDEGIGRAVEAFQAVVTERLAAPAGRALRSPA